MEDIKFLEPNEVLRMHSIIVDMYGGLHGVRDMGLLESALSEPKASFGGQYLYTNIHLMASAYIYYIIKNHAFLDGNKRTGVASGLLFLKRNNSTGVRLDWQCGAIHELAIKVATSELKKDEIAKQLVRLEARLVAD